MAISDAVVGNLTTLYLAVIAATKAYGLATGRTFSGGCVILLSTAAVASILVASLAWDVSRKAARALVAASAAAAADGGGHGACRGGICWHGVADRSPAAQVRFRVPSAP
ncbi:homeobox-leucine zipper family protein /lipid-binding START domain-containing protein [Striga asiatica]|uniref:Homeobox-leucine zipper family protein /lipid-binding START domain-containing protein n=1 Tax=Striga asiatica TaxID=4170 RepID=A0A5A7QRD9_STRAF|nr:homeobox-leucine zipper family protein /lipid-binding START domain-containing protein [Striga asiatica]